MARTTPGPNPPGPPFTPSPYTLGSPTSAHHPLGCKPARQSAWATIVSFARFAPSASRRRSLSQSVNAKSGSAVNYITAGVGAASWTRIAAWLRKYTSFLTQVAESSGKGAVSAKMIRHNGLALDFLARIADEGRGRTRVAAAIRALNFIRYHLIPPRPPDLTPLYPTLGGSWVYRSFRTTLEPSFSRKACLGPTPTGPRALDLSHPRPWSQSCRSGGRPTCGGNGWSPRQ